MDGKLGIMVAAGNKVFLLGPRVYCIDTDEENPKWTEKKSMNEPRMCLSAVVFKGPFRIKHLVVFCIILDCNCFS